MAAKISQLEGEGRFREASLLNLEVQKKKQEQRRANNKAKENIFESM